MKYSPDAVLHMLELLQEMGVSYIVTGSLATNVYRPPRSTNDADFVVNMTPDELTKLLKRMEKDFEQEPQMRFETATGKLQHRFYFRKTSFLIEVFEARMDDPHERARFERSRTGEVEGRQAIIPTAEDIVIQKLRWCRQLHRPKDHDDVLDLFIFQKRSLDWPYIERWSAEHGTTDILKKIKGEADVIIARANAAD